MYWLHVFICVSSGITPSHHVQENYYRKSWSVWRPDSFFLFVCLLFVVNIPEEANYVINSVCWPSLALVLKEPGKLIIIINPPFFLCVTGILCCAPSCCVCIYKTSKIKCFDRPQCHALTSESGVYTLECSQARATILSMTRPFAAAAAAGAWSGVRCTAT